MKTKGTAITLAAVATIAGAIAYKAKHSKGLREVKKEDKKHDKPLDGHKK